MTVEPPRIRPKMYPAPEFPPRRPKLFARVPPAAFPAVMGLFGLGLALRRAAEALQFTPALPDLFLGGVSLLWVFCLVAYGAKLARRPSVLLEDLRVLPGRAGINALNLSGMLFAATLVPFSPDAARVILFAFLALHAALALVMIRVLLAAPPEAREVTPVWHLSFVGFIIGAVSAVPLGLTELATWILYGTIPVALGIYAASLVQLVRRVPPAPLRPLLAIHLAPASLFTIVAASLGLGQIALGFLVLAGVIVTALIFAAQWMTVSGFSPLWGAFTFPMAAFCSAMLALGFDITATFALIPAVGFIPFVAFRVMQAWAKGALAAKTNAAEA
ncbi:TDT family transporter [Aliigemmobacter aestuarii]|nr:tellurium resistance protein [Gemmobacter aestuarii]